MLQRAASNAYSWWWASHIRTKQSKWLEQSLQDMDELVQGMLKLIEEDGDSFAKRAEMYYKRRPELISSVEEAYKQFRSLADRYDLMSKELQNANHTIATVFPEQVQFGMSEEDDGPNMKFPQNPQIPGVSDAKIPQVPKAPIKELKNIISKASKQYRGKKPPKAQNANKVEEKSGLTKDEALEEITKLQKDILALQTVKEFVKSSYENGVAKYWGIESQIMEMQQKVSRLQDEFNMDTVIEDHEARTLMAQAALKSCQETLAVLQEKQEKTTIEAKEEYKRIEVACQRLQSLRQKYLQEQSGDENPKEGDADGSVKVGDKSKNLSKDVADLLQETNEFEALPEKTEESLNLSSLACLTVSQLAEKIDQLVNKVISLETAVSSHTVLVNTLRSETDELNAQIQNLEEDNENLIDDTQNLSTRVKAMEEKLNKVQDLNKNVESRNSNLQTNFAVARTNLDHLSEKLSSVKADEELDAQTNPDHVAEKLSSVKADEALEETNDTSNQEARSPSEEEIKDKKDTQILRESDERFSASKTEEMKEVKEVDMDVHGSDPSAQKRGEVKRTIRKTGTFLERILNEQVRDGHSDDSANAEAQGNTEKSEDLNWQQMLLNGMEDKEKILLKEYTTVLRNYKDVKKKLNEAEKKERESEFDIALQIRELKKAITKRDEEIVCLRQRLNNMEADKDVNEDSSTQLSSSSGDQGVQSETGNADSDVNRDVVNNTTPITDEDAESKLIFIDRTPSISIVEEKLRMDIDAILDENLDFWLRFSTAFHQVQKFKTEAKDLQDEISILREKKKPDGSFATQIKSEILPIYKHLREIQRDLSVWLEQSASLKDELKTRFASLCSIQEDITRALREGVEEEEIKFSSHQAAKLQGEILNMKQENNKVREELRAGLDHVTLLQLQIGRTLTKLNEEFGLSSDQPESMNRHRVPLRSFIFGTKTKKQKNSIFSCMHPNRRYQIVKAGTRASNPSSS